MQQHEGQATVLINDVLSCTHSDFVNYMKQMQSAITSLRMIQDAVCELPFAAAPEVSSIALRNHKRGSVNCNT